MRWRMGLSSSMAALDESQTMHFTTRQYLPSLPPYFNLITAAVPVHG